MKGESDRLGRDRQHPLAGMEYFFLPPSHPINWMVDDCSIPKEYMIQRSTSNYSLWGSNPRPMAHKTIALTTELREPCAVCNSCYLGALIIFRCRISNSRHWQSIEPVEYSISSNPKSDPLRTRTWNLRLRRPTPYPLGQRAMSS